MARHNAGAASDAEVRVKWGVPPLDCYTCGRRHCYLARVATCHLPSLRAMLSFVSPRGQCLQWTTTVIDDLRILKASIPNLLGEAQLPHQSPCWFWA